MLVPTLFINQKMYLKILNETDDNIKIIRRVVTKELINKYSKRYPCLKDLIVDGYRWKAITLWDEEDNLIGQVCVVHTDDIPADDKRDQVGNMIQAMEVTKKFRGQGFGTRLLNIAIRDLKGRYLRVDKKNKIAYNLYLKRFKVLKDYKTKESGKIRSWWLMKLNNSK